MSEPSSLYISIKIDKEKLQRFFQQKPKVQIINDNWRLWWDSRDMYSKQGLEHIPSYQTETNRQVLDEFLSDRHLGAYEAYDPASACWTFTAIYFTENYLELLPMLALLKDLATYQGQGAAGIALIYDYLWGSDAIMAYMEFLNQEACITTYTNTAQIDPSVLYVSNQYLEKVLNIFSKRFEDRT